ncbi:MAG: sigma-70 family RNA polymerase sigma factor [bacterium]|nr:sigma-70 family RNA polymerase sigma factor [bacterium]
MKADNGKLEQERLWLIRFKKDPKEYDRVFLQYSPTISRYLMSRVGDDEVAAELTQETFVRAFNRFLTFEWRGISLLAFLFKIANNVLNNWRKEQYRISKAPLDFEAIPCNSSHSPSTNLSRKEDQLILDECFNTLTGPQRNCLELFIWYGLGTRDIAKVLKMKEPTVKSHLQRGRAKLHEGLKDKGLSLNSFDGIIDTGEGQSDRKKWDFDLQSGEAF